MTSGAPPLTSLGELKTLFGDAIRRLRKTRELTQKRLAEISGVSRSQVGAYERGERWAMAKNLARLLNALEVTASQFLTAVHSGAGASIAATEAGTSIAEIDRPEDLEVTDLARRGWTGDSVQIQIKELSLVIPADRLSIFSPSLRSRRGDRNEP